MKEQEVFVLKQVEDTLQALLKVYTTFPEQLELAKEELKRVEEEIQNILHIIELDKELKELRKKRRKLKDEIELLEAVNEIHNYSNINKGIIGNIIGKVRNIIRKQENRRHTVRIRKDLQYLFKKE